MNAQAATTTGADRGRPGDPVVHLDDERRAVFAAVADHLIPAAHGMPSARDVIGDERLRFVLAARPDLDEPVRAALRPELGSDPAARLAALERDEPELHSALLQVIVFAYYTDAHVRDILGYPGQLVKRIDPGAVEPYVTEGLIAQVRARGPIWKDPATGRRAEARADAYAPDSTGATDEAPPERDGGATVADRTQPRTD